MNDFKKDLEYSHDCEAMEMWESAYRHFFPTMASSVTHGQDGEHQRAGVDRSIILANSKQILIDEKARRIHDTGDIMVEYVSNDRMETLGWAEKPLRCDYIAYAFVPSKKVYLLPFTQLQNAWHRNKDEWLKKYRTKRAPNKNYNTLNCPVPTSVLFSKMGGCLRYNGSEGGSV
jgi:hypothetical protein